MGARGMAPREGTVKPNQGKYEAHALPPEGYQGEFPKLPSGHHARTRAWYLVWAKSPQAAVFVETDWQRLHQLAFVVDELHAPEYDQVTGKRVSPAVTALVAEIRQNEKLLGATVSDRSSMYMKIAKATAPESATEPVPAAPESRYGDIKLVG